MLPGIGLGVYLGICAVYSLNGCVVLVIFDLMPSCSQPGLDVLGESVLSFTRNLFDHHGVIGNQMVMNAWLVYSLGQVSTEPQLVHHNLYGEEKYYSQIPALFIKTLLCLICLLIYHADCMPFLSLPLFNALFSTSTPPSPNTLCYSTPPPPFHDNETNIVERCEDRNWRKKLRESVGTKLT